MGQMSYTPNDTSPGGLVPVKQLEQKCKTLPDWLAPTDVSGFKFVFT
jgi:hypothetical protein